MTDAEEERQKVLARERNRRYYRRQREKDPEGFLAKHRARAKRYRELHPDKCRESKKRSNHSLEARKNAVERTNRWRQENKEKFLSQRRDYYERNKARLLPYWKHIYARTHPGKRIRGIIREIKRGGIDYATAIEKIRAIVDSIDGALTGGGKHGSGL